jgi:hypothetical protein
MHASFAADAFGFRFERKDERGGNPCIAFPARIILLPDAPARGEMRRPETRCLTAFFTIARHETDTIAMAMTSWNVDGNPSGHCAAGVVVDEPQGGGKLDNPPGIGSARLAFCTFGICYRR